MADSSLAPVDRQIASKPNLSVFGHQIPFQFPPKVVSESNSTNWKVSKDMLSFEPLKILGGMAGRTINVEWEYIATDNTFKGAFIAAILRNLKSYYFEFNAQNRIHPTVSFQYGAIVPVAGHFRMMNVNITYGQELVIDGGDLYPLYTKVAIALELATTLGAKNGPDKIKAADLERLKPNWY